jgi:hypothetical protein
MPTPSQVVTDVRIADDVSERPEVEPNIAMVKDGERVLALAAAIAAISRD